MKFLKHLLISFLFLISLSTATAEYKLVSKSTPTRLTKKIIIPKSASGLKLKEIDVVGSRYYADNNIKWLVDDELVLGAKVAGTLKIRVTARYGWFGDFESPPELELEISKSERKKLPYIQGQTPGYFDLFNILNSEEIIKEIFDEKTIDNINTRKIALVEQEVDLVISNINFGHDCGLRYAAVIKSAKRVLNSNLIAKNEGMMVHC